MFHDFQVPELNVFSVESQILLVCRLGCQPLTHQVLYRRRLWRQDDTPEKRILRGQKL